MLSNSTNINKALSQFSSYLNTKRTKAYDVENAGPSFGHAQQYGRFKLVFGVKPTLPNIN